MPKKTIILRAFEKEDIKKVWEWFNKEEILQYTFYGYPTAKDRWEKFYKENKNNLNQVIKCNFFLHFL